MAKSYDVERNNRILLAIQGVTERMPVNCFDCQHRNEVRLPSYLGGSSLSEHRCHNNLAMLCKNEGEHPDDVNREKRIGCVHGG